MLCQEYLDVAHVQVQGSGDVSKRDSKLSLQQSCRFLTAQDWCFGLSQAPSKGCREGVLAISWGEGKKGSRAVNAGIFSEP